MKFLIRDIFIATLFIAIGAMYFSTEKNLLVVTARLASQDQANAAARTLNSKLMSERDMVQADIDCSIQIDDLAKQIESHFPALQAKYSSIEPRDNKTVSVRQVPMLIDRQTGIDLTRIRIHVPTDRRVFLKFGVAALTPSATDLQKQTTQTQVGTKWEQHFDLNLDGFTLRETLEVTTRYDRPTSWETINEYSVAGPYERRLRSGLIDLDWSNRLNSQGFWEMQLSLNEQTLLTTVLELKEACNSYNSLLAKDQLDFAADDQLPGLFTSARVTTSSSKLPPPQFQIHVWLEDQSSGFGEFPGTVLK
jgi:hypothetical protein